MKEENKYYIPEPEEFHIGFEYEEGNKAIRENVTGWTKYQIEDAVELESVFDGYTVCRVKYLDKTDIEELGWQEVEDSDKSWSWGAEYYVPKNKEEWFTLKFSSENKVIISVSHKYDWEGHDSLEFEVKNKSELKKLMKQLNIL